METKASFNETYRDHKPFRPHNRTHALRTLNQHAKRVIKALESLNI